MNASEAQAILRLLQATTMHERQASIRGLASVASRVDPTWRREVMALVDEAGIAARQEQSAFSVGGLRDLSAVSAEQASVYPAQLRPVFDASTLCDALVRLSPGPDPICSQKILGLVEEWCQSWGRVDDIVQAGIESPGAMLISGPTGTGKSTMVAAIARRLDGKMTTVVLDAHRVVDQYLGGTASKLQKAFEAVAKSRSALVIEEADALVVERHVGSKKNEVGEMNRITTAVMRLLDTVRVPVVMTTNRSDMIDPALLRRCDYRVEMQVPDVATCNRIVAVALGQDLHEPASETIFYMVPMVEQVPLAKRARRRGFLNGTDPNIEFGTMLNEVIIERSVRY